MRRDKLILSIRSVIGGEKLCTEKLEINASSSGGNNWSESVAVVVADGEFNSPCLQLVQMKWGIK